MKGKGFSLNHPEQFRQKALYWAEKHRVAAYYTGNNYKLPFGTFPEVLAVDSLSEIRSDSGNAFKQLQEFIQDKKSFIPGFLSYDLKNEIEDLPGRHPKKLHYPELFFFQPGHLITFSGNKVIIESADPDQVFQAILSTEKKETTAIAPVIPATKTGREQYIETVSKIKQHIINGDVYEANYCIEFLAERVQADPVQLFLNITEKSPMPFSSFFKVDDLYICCGSPERFLKKDGDRLLSQPMKGTASRSKNPAEDEMNKQLLFNSEKERAENMMIVDLVRNDLARSCIPGSVKVEELFGVYPFPHVFQMISTISGKVRPEVTAVQCIINAFPMGSMTGAPKIRAMELIDQYEESRRGIFSGACGYFLNGSDFDLNVVIRSVIYDKKNSLLSCHFGSAITADSDPDHEYRECMLKAEKIMQILRQE